MVFIISNSDCIDSKIDNYLKIRNNIIKSKKKVKVKYSNDEYLEYDNYEQSGLFNDNRNRHKKIQKFTKINRNYYEKNKEKKLFKYTNKLDRRKSNTPILWKQTRYNLRSRKK